VTTTVNVTLQVDGNGYANNATAESRINAPVAKVWEVVTDVDKYPQRVPMISKVRLDGKRATVQLKFKLSLFSVSFEFVVDEVNEPMKWIELRYVSGEPKNIRLRFELEPLDDGKACLLRATGEFDVLSLGWLAKYFLKHHPEIQCGILPGVAIGLLEAMRRAAEGKSSL
jgi:ribosome-associated toxin RatA of RatAB toxin-antitoxin module